MALLSETGPADRPRPPGGHRGARHDCCSSRRRSARPETAHVARQVLDEIVCLSDLVTLEEVNFVLEQDRAP